MSMDRLLCAIEALEDTIAQLIPGSSRWAIEVEHLDMMRYTLHQQVSALMATL